MPQQKMIADMRFTYDNRKLSAGDEFIAQNEKHALALTASKRAHKADNGDTPTDDDKPKRRQYRRRDMTAER